MTRIPAKDCRDSVNSSASLRLSSLSKDRNYFLQNTRITFYGDVLPILSSRGEGRKYDCTSCHSEYKNPNTLLQDGEIDRMLHAMRGVDSSFMPRIGDRVPDNYLQMLRKWKLNPIMGEPYETQVRLRELQALDQSRVERISSSVTGEEGLSEYERQKLEDQKSMQKNNGRVEC